jgi:uncharacterized protein
MYSTPAFLSFLQKNITKNDFFTDPSRLTRFALLDDFDIIASIKIWVNHPDPILATLCFNLLNRKLFRVELQNSPFSQDYVNEIRNKTARKYDLQESEVDFFVNLDKVQNKAYNPLHDKIKIRVRNNELLDISEASEQLNIAVLPTTVSKYLLCYPKDINSNQSIS